MNIAIIDDEINARELLKNMLDRYCPDMKIMGEADSVQSGFVLLNKIKPDLLFLDIKMNDGSGFDLLDLLETTDFKLIFTTAYDEFAIKAFKFGAVDYLLKPITPIDLKDCIKRIEQQEMVHKEQLRIVNNYNVNAKKIAIPTNKGIHLINLEQLVYCKGEGSYTSFCTIEGKFLVSKNLSYYSDLIQDSSFFRVHQSYLVNLNHIKTIQKSDGGFLVMTTGCEISISRRKKDELFSILKV